MIRIILAALTLIAALAGCAAPQSAAAPTPVAVSAPAPDRGPDGERATVARVVDGDTFEITDGRKVRVLGIDSCEDHSPKTPGGADATAEAERVLNRNMVTLTSEPGVDVDRYGRHLRYVWVKSVGDYGTHMVRYDHTGVYQGDNDASDEYLAPVVRARPGPGRDPAVRPGVRRVPERRRRRRRRCTCRTTTTTTTTTARTSAAGGTRSAERTT
jgi:micrococcal nuclease